MLGEGRQNKIQARVSALLREIDPEVHLHKVVLDSTRQQLAFILQKGEWPIVIGMNWLEYVSHRDDDLRRKLAEALCERLKVAQARQAREEES